MCISKYRVVVVDSLMCVLMHFFSFCMLQDGQHAYSISPLLSALAYCTHRADPTSAHAACSGHCGSTHLLPHTHTKWATQIRALIHVGEVFHHAEIRDYAKLFLFFSSYLLFLGGTQHVAAALRLTTKALFACANLLHVTLHEKKKTKTKLFSV